MSSADDSIEGLLPKRCLVHPEYYMAAAWVVSCNAMGIPRLLLGPLSPCFFPLINGAALRQDTRSATPYAISEDAPSTQSQGEDEAAVSI